MRDGIFINYRRDDSRHSAGRIYDALCTAFGRRRVFMDIDKIGGGKEFPVALDEALALSRVLIAVIGQHWTGNLDAHGQRRLDDPHDFVRREIADALRRQITIIPVLLDDAPWPERETLPDELKPLHTRNYVSIRHETFGRDISALVKACRDALRPSPQALRARNINLARWAAVAIALAVGATAQQIYVNWSSQTENVRHASEMVAWEVATRQNNIAAYQTYIEMHSNGTMIADAKRRIDEMKEEAAKQQQQLKEAEEKRRLDEENRRKADAQHASDMAAWVMAKRQDNITAYQTYIEVHPDGVMITDAKRRIDELKEEAAKQQQLKEVQEKAKLDEENRRKAEALRALDAAAWDTAKRQDTVDAYRTYIKSHPDGAMIADAKRRVDELNAPPAHHEEPPPERWNSAAAAIWQDHGQTRVAIGYSDVRQTADDARASALEACRSAGGQDCKAIGAWNDGCLYITTGRSSNRAGWGSGGSIEAALKKCQSYGFTCKQPIGGCLN